MSMCWVWYEEIDFSGFDVIVLLGGFSYGDYLCCGVIVCFVLVLQFLIDFVVKGG